VLALTFVVKNLQCQDRYRDRQTDRQRENNANEQNASTDTTNTVK